MRYPDKFQMTPDQALFLAKKKWDENVYCGMKMEARNVTFPQTRTILDGVNVPGVQLDDIQAILNMRDAWRYLLANPTTPVDLAFLCKLNEYVARNEALAWGTRGDLWDGLHASGAGGRDRGGRADGDPGDGQGAHSLCLGRTRTVLLGREQAHQSAAG